MLSLLQAAQAVAVATPNELSTGQWIGIVTFGVMIAGVLIGFGATLTEARYIKKNTEAAITDIRKSVERELQAMKASLAEIVAGQREWFARQVEDATWRAQQESAIATATATAEEAKATAHRARNVAQEHEPRIVSLEEERERREEYERRTGLPDRRA